ncbi:MAG: SpoIIE family protein phosphatase [Bacteroidota bacterium]
MRNRNLRIVLIALCGLLSIYTYAQTREIDSLKKIVSIEKNDSLKAFAYSKIGQKLWYINPDSSVYYTNISKDIATRKNVKSILSYCYNNYGVIDYIQGNYTNSLTKYFEGLKYARKNSIIEGILLNNIGMSYAELKDGKKALEYYQRTLGAKKMMGDSSRFATTYINIGNSFVDLNKHDDAKHYFDTALILAHKYNDLVTMADAYGNIGNHYFRKKEFVEAEKNCREALRIKKSVDDIYGYATSLSDLSSMLMSSKRDKDVESILKEAEKMSLDNKFIDLLLPIYRNLSDYYRSRSDYKAALMYLSKSMAIQDTILTEGKLREAAIKENQYSFEMIQLKDSLENVNKAREINLVHEKEMFQQRAFTYGGIIAFVCMLLVALFIFKAFNEKKRSHLIISQQKKEVELQKHIIEEHQKETIDSINYAKRIQYALLANDELLKANLSEYFVFFKPKDIVSGDFYWATTHGSKFYLAVCDSTGHGVPGAFMSLLNMGFLSEAIKEKNILEPHEVLNYVRKRLIESIGSEGQQDGMDAVLICMDNSLVTDGNRSFTYAAANNEPVLVRENEVVILPKDKMPVGKGERKESFKLQSIILQKGDHLYLYTDGYADQFGGPKGKKFKYKQLNEMLLANVALPLNKQSQILSKTFEDWKSGLEQVDDVAIIGIKI